MPDSSNFSNSLSRGASPSQHVDDIDQSERGGYTEIASDTHLRASEKLSAENTGRRKAMGPLIARGPPMFLRCVAILALLVSGAARAEEPLTGVFELAVSVGELSPEAKACGLSREALRQALLLPVRAYTKVREVAFVDGKPVLQMHVVSLDKLPAYCSHYVRLDVLQRVPVNLPGKPGARVFAVTLWTQAALLTSPRHNGSQCH